MVDAKNSNGAMKPTRVMILAALAAIAIANFPSIAIKAFLVTGFLTTIDVRSTTLFKVYHSTATFFLKEKAAKPLPELFFEGHNATNWEDINEEVRKLSNNYRNPIVLRRAGAVEPQLQDENFWLREYGKEEVLCIQIKKNELKNNSEAFCTIEEFFNKKKENKLDGLYVSGASSIFNRRPELQRLVKAASSDHDILDSKPTAHQLFIGFGGQFSETHHAMASNLFYMIKGRKSWVFFPPSQTPYLKPAMNANPFASQTHTIAQDPVEGVSPWVSKLERYEAVLEPGDILFNPSWWWHSVYNLGSKDDLVIGCPVRYQQPKSSLANSPFFTLFMLGWVKMAKGGAEAFARDFNTIDAETGRDGFERMIVGNRATTGNAVE